jgi:hypothetical protein
MDSCGEDKLVASCVHGVAAPAAFEKALNDAVATFVVDRNVDNFAKCAGEGDERAPIKEISD